MRAEYFRAGAPVGRVLSSGCAGGQSTFERPISVCMQWGWAQLLCGPMHKRDASASAAPLTGPSNPFMPRKDALVEEIVCKLIEAGD